MMFLQKLLEDEQKRKWEEEKKIRNYEGMFDEDKFQKRDSDDDGDDFDDFM